jgi:hypothetical protein
MEKKLKKTCQKYGKKIKKNMPKIWKKIKKKIIKDLRFFSEKTRVKPDGL